MLKARTKTIAPGRGKAIQVPGPAKQTKRTIAKERVLIEFPTTLLKRADEAANGLEKSRSELIRAALEQYLNRMESSEFEMELAEAYAANASMNLALAEEFSAVDHEGF